MAMCNNLRRNNVFMNVMNYEYFGHLIDGEDFNTSLTSPDFYMMLTNKADWEQKYIHPDYIKNLDPENVPLQV